MTSLSSYTPLESLLLFQALQADGVTSIPFNKISSQLQSIPLIRNDATFDSARLAPSALQDLYLGLLKEEAKKDVDRLEARNKDAQDGFASPNSRKRRAPTPSLPTVDEAAKHAHLIPGLIYRLYATYREKVVEEIRSEERHYDTLTREIKEIEEGQWDDRLGTEQEAEQAARAQLVEKQQQQQQQQQPVPQHTQPNPRTILPVPDSDQKHMRPSPAASLEPQSVLADAPQNKGTPPERPNHVKVDAAIDHELDRARASPSPHPPKPSTTTALPPLSQMAPDDPTVYRSPSQPTNAQLPISMQAGATYRASPPVGPQMHPGQHPRPALQPSGQKLPHTAMARSSPSSSPRPVLPLPPGMKSQPQSPIMQNSPANQRPPLPLQPHPPQHYPSPNQRVAPMPLQPADPHLPRPGPSHLPTPPGYPQPYPQYQPVPQPYPAPPYQHAQQTIPPRAPPHVAPHQGGVQLPPFQLGPQEPNKSHSIGQQHGTAQSLRATPNAQKSQPLPQYAPYGQTAQQAPLSQQDQALLVSNIVQTLKTRPWATWKAARPAHLPQPTSDESPLAEPLSPVQQRAVPVARAPAPAPAADQPRDTSPGGLRVPKDTKLAPSSSKVTKPSRKSTRRSRAGSTASSAVGSSVRARTRSQSVTSHTDTLPEQSEASATSRLVKDEPTTPADFHQHEILAGPEETPAIHRGRQRRGTLQAQAQPSSKRKRQRSPSPTADESEAVPTYLAPRNDVVAASRNFQRLSAVIMNDISTHKHAGPFQKPVREKDAEGYTDIIKRPQDLKSLKAAITAGTRAISAATVKESTTDSPSATPSGSKEGGTILLEKTADLVPPRAVVNSSQLEKEVMRMFANAVMFNPGEGGMVQDAREMADDIEAKVRDWRSAERQVEGRDEDDEPATGGAGPGKRRKL